MTSPGQVTTQDAADDTRNRDILVYVNGDLLPRAEAKVSVYDSGFMLGDGMCEGLRLFDVARAVLEEHMVRLYASCRVVGLEIGMDRKGLLAALNQRPRRTG